jgi:outer membrane biosynthesis protein TonB
LTEAASPRRRLGALTAGALLALCAVVLPAAGARAQDCPLLDPDCQPPTTEEPTTTVEETTTTEEVVEEEPTPTTRRRDEDQDEEEQPDGTVPVETTEATVTVTTLRDVLVPGDGTEGAETTTTTEPQLAAEGGGISDETLILVIVAGLTLVAVVTGLLTWRYWDATRPPHDGR